MHRLTAVSAWLVMILGAGLLAACVDAGMFPGLIGAVPAVLLISGGARSLLFTDLRAPQMSSIGSLVTLVLAPVLGLTGGLALGLGAMVLAVLAFLASGWFRIRSQPLVNGVPAPAATLPYSACVAGDDAVLGCMAALTPGVAPQVLKEAVSESVSAHAFLADGGYLDDPGAFHLAPPALITPQLTSLDVGGQACECLNFDSEFEPRDGLPGRDRWLGYAENQQAHVLLLRNGQPGPWLIMVHGFGMGDYMRDFKTFKAEQLHRRHNLNLALFTLPVHGPRSPAGFNGAKFFGDTVADFLHAESQAIWDLRRLHAWLRAEGATSVGMLGISLGGYTSALFASVEENLDAVIVGVPPTDMIAHRAYLAGTQERRVVSLAGVSDLRDSEVYRPVSPLAMAPLVPHPGRHMFAATGDQFVPIEQVRALWEHWDRPNISWCRGGHLSALMQKAPRTLIDEALSATICTPRDGPD